MTALERHQVPIFVAAAVTAIGFGRGCGTVGTRNKEQGTERLGVALTFTNRRKYGLTGMLDRSYCGECLAVLEEFVQLHRRGNRSRRYDVGRSFHISLHSLRKLAAQLQHAERVPAHDVGPGDGGDGACVGGRQSDALLLWDGGWSLLRHGVLPSNAQSAG